MENEMEKVLRGVARKLYADELANDMADAAECIQKHEETLRESGLLRLLEAGQAMFEVTRSIHPRAEVYEICHQSDCVAARAWDAALAALKEQAHA